MIIQVLAQTSLLMFAYMSVFFIISQLKKDNSIVDIAWGGGFILAALFSLVNTDLFLPRQILVTILVCIWGLRLSGYLFMRNWGKGEDIRYTDMKKKWGKYSALYSFFFVFMLQGLLIIVISYPVLLINNAHLPGLSLLDCIGLTIWLIGFICESVADIQLSRFLNLPSNKGKIMKQGLWKFSRHPNYFGEILIWWGIWVIALSVPLGWSAIISPISISILIIFISGIPMSERYMENLEGFDEYKRKTSVLIPWQPQV